MKKKSVKLFKENLLTLLFSFAMLLSFNTAKSQTRNFIQVSQNNDTLQVLFALPSYELLDTSLFELYGITEIFKYIEIDDEFGIIDSMGLPELPQLTFDLNVPYNAVDFKIEIVSTNTTKIGIDKKIMPSQDGIDKENSVFSFSMNNKYYRSSGDFCNYYIEYNESFIVFGEQGINITIFPFIYHPNQDSITVLNNAIFAISYTTDGRASEGYYSETKESYLNSLFKNYEIDNSKVIAQEIYLMITPPEYESTLTYFANYKRNIGYDVKVVTTTTTGITSSSIKNYIKTQYNSTSTRPTFVLLVGDVDKIPAYEGNASGNSKNNPITDLGYSLLAGSDNLADVFLGRFSVFDVAELKNIINKTIYMEMNIHRFTKKAKFLAGSDNSWCSTYMKNQFKKAHNYVIPYSFIPLGYNCQKLYQPNNNQAINAFNDNPLFYIYSGHGSQTSINEFSFQKVFSNATNTIFPFVFSFACLSGDYAYPNEPCIGELLIRAKDKSAVAYFGCSVNSQTNTDVAIEKKIFGDSFKKDNQKLSAIINTGMRRFTYVIGIRKKIKNIYLKAYNLLGDPSFNTRGIGCRQDFVFNHPEVFKKEAKVTYRADNLIQNNNSFIVENGADVKLMAGNSVRLLPGFQAEAGSNVQIQIASCGDGTTLNSAPDNNNYDLSEPTEINVNYDEISTYTVMEIDEIINPALFSVFPNPVTDDFSMAYTLEKDSFVQIDLYNMSGVHIKSFLQLSQQEAGIYYQNFSLSGFPSGLYILVFKDNSQTISSKIVKQ